VRAITPLGQPRSRRLSAHLHRALAVGVALGFADVLSKLITGVERFQQKVQGEIETRRAA
jgi:hypothetical protein